MTQKQDPMERSLSGDEMQKLLPDVKIFTYSQLFEIEDIDDMLFPTGSCVILYQTKKNYGHWTCMFVRKRTLCFYDSYAMVVDDPKRLEYIDDKILVKMNETHAFLAELMKNSRYPYLDCNEYRFQAKNTTTCGRHVICRLWLRDFNNDEYNNFMHSTKLSPDELVTVLTENAFDGFKGKLKYLKFDKRNVRRYKEGI